MKHVPNRNTRLLKNHNTDQPKVHSLNNSYLPCSRTGLTQKEKTNRRIAQHTNPSSTRTIQIPYIVQATTHTILTWVARGDEILLPNIHFIFQRIHHHIGRRMMEGWKIQPEISSVENWILINWLGKRLEMHIHVN